MKKTKPMAIVTEDRKRKREGKKEKGGEGRRKIGEGGERERERVGAIDSDMPFLLVPLLK